MVVVFTMLFIYYAAHDATYGKVGVEKTAMNPVVPEGNPEGKGDAAGTITATTSSVANEGFAVRMSRKLSKRIGTPSYKGSMADDSILFGGLNEYMGWTVGQIILVRVFW